MFCNQCGQQNAAGSSFCATCGGALASAAPPMMGQPMMGQPIMGQPMMGMGQPMAAPSTSGLAIAGFVLSFFCGLLGLIFSAIAKSEIAKSEGRLIGDGLATAGIIISIISMLLGFVIAVGK